MTIHTISPFVSLEYREFIAAHEARGGDYTKIETLVYPPIIEHRQTFIILHGRGFTSVRLAEALLSSTTTKGKTLQQVFPHAKLVFPNAPLSQPQVFDHLLPIESKTARHMLVNQWFDQWMLPCTNWMMDGCENPGLQTCWKYLHQLLKDEIRQVGSENVVLWGSRQGCAAALSALLTWDRKPFAAVVGMSGWLPFGNQVWDFANGDDSEVRKDIMMALDEFWPKEHEDGEDFDWPTKAIKYFRYELLAEEKRGKIFQQVPVFLGYSRNDRIAGLGQEAVNCLQITGAKVQGVEYEKLDSPHGFCREMLDDVFQLLRSVLRPESAVISGSG